MQHNPRSQQRNEIIKRLDKFSLSEFKDICHQIGIDYENLPGYTNSSRNDLNRELHRFMERQGKLNEFHEFLARFAREKTRKKKRKSRPRKTRDERHSEIAQKLYQSIFVRLNKGLAYSLLGSVAIGFVMASILWIYGYSSYEITQSFLLGFVFIPTLYMFDIFIFGFFGKWIGEEARRQNFYRLSVDDRKDSKDKLHKLLNERFKFPAKWLLLLISVFYLKTRKDGKWR